MWSTRWGLLGIAGGELLLGLWLLSGAAASRARQVALVTFLVFTAVAAWKTIAGDSSCGCMGRVETKPWHMLIVDTAVVLLLWRVRFDQADIQAGSSRPRAVLTGFASGAAIIGVVAVFSVDIGRLVAVSREKFQRDRPSVVLLPEKWLGQRFPLLDDIDVKKRLETGEWCVVLHRNGCKRCEKAIAELRKVQARERTEAGVALIEIPSDGGQDPEQSADLPSWFAGRLGSNKQWVVETPILLRLRDGIVFRIGQSPGQVVDLDPRRGTEDWEK
jgi:hypothetical protein